MIFIPQRIILKNLTPEFFFAECERQYVFEQAIEKRWLQRNILKIKLNNSSKRKRASLAKEIMNIKDTSIGLPLAVNIDAGRYSINMLLLATGTILSKISSLFSGEFKNN